VVKFLEEAQSSLVILNEKRRKSLLARASSNLLLCYVMKELRVYQLLKKVNYTDLHRLCWRGPAEIHCYVMV
jgi:hypothetical protein